MKVSSPLFLAGAFFVSTSPASILQRPGLPLHSIVQLIDRLLLHQMTMLHLLFCVSVFASMYPVLGTACKDRNCSIFFQSMAEVAKRHGRIGRSIAEECQKALTAHALYPEQHHTTNYTQ